MLSNIPGPKRVIKTFFFIKSKDFKFIIALILIGITVMLGSWFGINYTSLLILKRESAGQIDQWVTFITENISGFGNIHARGEISDEDKKLFDVANKVGGVLGYNIFDVQGNVIASSNPEKIGQIYDNLDFLPVVRKGKKHFELIFDQNPAGEETLIVESYAPIFQNAKFIGAVEVYLDFTEDLNFFRGIRNYIFLVSASFLIALGIVVNLLFFLHWLELTQATGELRESEEKFRNIAEGSIQGIIIERNKESLFANDSFARIFGYDSNKDILAFESLEHLAPEKEILQIKKYSQDLLRGYPTATHFQIQMFRSDGTPIWLDTNLSVITWEGKPAILRTVVNISKRKKAEEEIRLLAAAIEHAAEDIIITNEDGIIKYVNPAFEKTTGFSRSEVAGENPRLLNSGKMDVSYFRLMWETLIQGHVWTGQHLNRKKDGTLYNVEAVNSPIFDANGKITGYISVERDITSQLELEKRLLRSQKMEAIGGLAGGIAHDFNNLLAPIIGFTELTMDNLEVNSEEYKNLGEVLKAATRARDIISQIMMFSKKSEDQLQTLQLQPIVREIIGLIRSTIPKNVTIVENIGSRISSVKGIPGEIHQILMNLCVNASNAMPDGGELNISLEEVSLDNQPIYSGEKISGDFVRLRIKDTGIGMDADTKARIFEPLFTTKGPEKGTGLGLSTVKSILTKHHYHVDVESKLSVGTTFDIIFPAVTPIHEKEPESEEHVQGGNESILVVDDENSIGTMVKSVLEKDGYLVTNKTDSLQALDMFEKEPDQFDLVIMDQMMPGLKGEELLDEFRKLHRNIPVILYSGYLSEFTDHTAKKRGFTAYLEKPVESDEIRRVVRYVLDNSPKNAPA